MPAKKLFLLDAMALIYRAHFALSKNPRVNSKGMNTGAIMGFTNTLWEIMKKEKPTHLGVAFDTSAPTFRHQAFAEYKAQRQEQPEDIQIAIPWVKKIVKAFNVPVLQKDGFEADDIIGTLAKKMARQEGMEVFMMTPDKDYGQLVEEQIWLYKPSYMGNGVEIMGVPEVLKKWDIERIEQVVDMLGLQGDSVDNIPGIPGIGPKTASKLLATYGSVEGLIEHADELKGKQKERVKENAEQAILSKQLATIDTEVDIECTEEDLRYGEPDREALKQIFEELEFKTIAKRMLGEEVAAGKGKKRSSGNSQQGDLFAAPAAAEAVEEKAQGPYRNIDTSPHRYHLVDTPELRQELIHFLGLQTEFCFDTETTSLAAHETTLVGMSFAWQPGEAYYVPVPADEAEARAIVQEFQPVFGKPEVTLIAQNIKFDLLVLQRYGLQVRGKLFDTMIAHYLIEPDMRHNMDFLAESYLHYTPVPIEELIGKKGKKQGNMADVDVKLVTEYAAEDADITLQLKKLLAPELETKGQAKLYNEVEAPLVGVLASTEQNGVRLDVESLKSYSKELEQEIAALEKRIFEKAGTEFNIGSPKQLGEVLFDKLKLIEKPKKTRTGQYATGEEILVTLAPEHEIVAEILDFRQLQKLKSTYVDALPELISPRDGLLHTSYNQAVAATGRLSSANPNLQNLPIRTERGREIRKAIVPRSKEFVIMAADYSQIELRIMAEFSKDETMLEAFKSGRDIHATTAAKINKVALEEVDGEMRRRAKTANFGIIYGISAFGLSQRLNIPRGEAAGIIEAYFNEFPAVKSYMDEVINFAREHEYVETILGRRRYLRDINSRNMTQRGFAERNAINAPIQGSAADMIKIAMINIHQWMQENRLKSRMTMQVHDELVFDAHRDEVDLLKENVIRLMKSAIKTTVPIEVEAGTGENWLEAH